MVRPFALLAVFVHVATILVSAQTRDQLLSRCADDEGDPDLRIAACTSLIQSGGEDDAGLTKLFVNRALAYQAKGEQDRALKDLETAGTLDGTNANVPHNRGAIYLVMGKLDIALREAERALAISPGFNLPHAIRAEVHRRRGEFAQAAPEFEAALSSPIRTAKTEKNIRSLQARNQQALRCGASEPDLSIAGCTSIIQDNRITSKAIAAAYNRRGVAYSRNNDEAAAYADYSEAILRDDSVPTYFTNRATVSTRLGKFEEAATDINRGIALGGNPATVSNVQGMLARQRGDYALALQRFTAALAAANESDKVVRASYTGNRGITYLLMQQYDDALRDLNAALALNPRNDVMLFARGVVAVRMGNAAAAEADFTAAKAIRADIESVMAKRLVTK